jgi:hypothetical protein
MSRLQRSMILTANFPSRWPGLLHIAPLALASGLLTFAFCRPPSAFFTLAFCSLLFLITHHSSLSFLLTSQRKYGATLRAI